VRVVRHPAGTRGKEHGVKWRGLRLAMSQCHSIAELRNPEALAGTRKQLPLHGTVFRRFENTTPPSQIALHSLVVSTLRNMGPEVRDV